MNDAMASWAGSAGDGALEDHLNLGEPQPSSGPMGNPGLMDAKMGAPRVADTHQACMHSRPPRVQAECGDLPFLIRRDGTWLYRGSPIRRKELVCLFAGILNRHADGSFWLENPAERGRIEVEDAPFVAVELDWTGDERDQVLSFRTNIDQIVTAGPGHPIRVAHDVLTCEPTPYIRIRDGEGSAPVEARIGRAVYYELVALAVPGLVYGQRVLGVWSRGCFFSLGNMPNGEE